MPKRKLFEDTEDDLLDDVDLEDLEDELEEDADLEDDDLDEEHDPINAEAKSVDSVDKAAKTGPRGKKRRGDKEGGDKTFNKADKGIVRELFDKLNSMKKEDVRKLHSIIMDEDFNLEDLDDENDMLEDVEYDFNADLDQLIQDEATLSEGFKEKSALIMETAIKAKLKEEVKRLEEAYDEMFEEATTEFAEDLVEKVDGYLNLVVEEWIKDNELAIHNGLRTEIAEGFMNSLKDLFIESYIEVPETQVNLVDDLAEQVETLEGENNTLVDRMIDMKEELEMYKRDFIISEMSSDLADTQINRLAELAESVDFDDEDSFREQVAVIKETYFGKKSKSSTSKMMNESLDEEVDEIELSDQMQSYVNALKKTKK